MADVIYTLLEADEDLTDATSYTTGSVTYSASLGYLLVVGSSDDDVSDVPVPTTTGITWTQLGTSQTDSGVRRRVTVFEAYPTNDGAGTKTTAIAFSTTQYNCQWHITSLANAHTTDFSVEIVTTNGNGFGDVGPTLTGVDAANSTFMAIVTNNTTSTLTATSPGTQIGATTTGGDAANTGRMLTTYDDVPDTTPQATISGTTNRRWAAIGVEVLFAAASQGITAPLISAGTTIYEPVIQAGSSISAPQVAAATTIYAPIVAGPSGGSSAYTLMTSGTSNTDGAGTRTTASVAYSAAQSYILVVGARLADTTAVTQPTIATTGVTWTYVGGQQTSGGTTGGKIDFWEGHPSTSGSATTDITYAETTISNVQWHIVELTQAHLTDLSVQYVDTNNNSFGEVGPTLSAFSDTANSTFVALILNNSTSTLSAGTGLTILGNTSTASDALNDGRMASAYVTSNDTSPTITISGTTNRRWAAGAIEVDFVANTTPIVMPAWSTGTTIYAPAGVAPAGGGAYQGYITAGTGGYGTSLAGSNSITVPALASGTTVYTPTTSAVVTQDFISATTVLYEPTISPTASQALAPALLTAGTTIYAPDILPAPGGTLIDFTDAFLDVQSAVFTPTVTGGSDLPQGTRRRGKTRYDAQEFVGLR